MIDEKRPLVAELRYATCGEGIVEVFRRRETSRRRVLSDVRSDEHIEISGWSLATHPWSLFERVYAVVDGINIYLVELGLARADVVHARRDESLSKCGFAHIFPVAGLGLGAHVMTFVGVVGERVQLFGDPMTFHVVVQPVRVPAYAPGINLPSRLRKASGTRTGPRNDGRSMAAIESGVSLFVEGWCASFPETHTADDVAIILAGITHNYRAPARRCTEAEAGIVLGPNGMTAGIQTCIDTLGIVPGAYRIVFELTTSGLRRSVPSQVWVEIMGNTGSWFPGLLPFYQRPPTCALDVALPAAIRKNEPLLISGWLHTPEPIGGVYVRFDQETTYTLTHVTAEEQQRPPTPLGRGSRFAGLMATQLPVGTHELEIIATDQTFAGAWLAQIHQFEIVADTPTSDSSQA